MTNYLTAFVIGHTEGLTNGEAAKLQSLHRFIELGRLNAERQATSIEVQTNRSSIKTTLDLAQHSLAQALRSLILTASVKDETNWEPTTHAARYWKYFQLEAILDWKTLEIPEQYSVAGHLGSIAFLAVKYDLYPATVAEAVSGLLYYFWQELGLSVEDAPATRYKNLQNQIGLDKTYLAELGRSALTLYPSYARFKQLFIGRENFESLPQRIWMGEFSDVVLSELENLQNKANTDSVFQEKYDFPYQPNGTISRMVSKSLFIGDSAGAAAVHQALIAEAYYNIYSLLIDLDIALTDFAKSAEHEPSRYELARLYSLVSDGYTCNAFLNTLSGAKQLAEKAYQNSLQWLATTGTPELEIDTYRLVSFL